MMPSKHFTKTRWLQMKKPFCGKISLLGAKQVHNSQYNHMQSHHYPCPLSPPVGLPRVRLFDPKRPFWEEIKRETWRNMTSITHKSTWDFDQIHCASISLSVNLTLRKCQTTRERGNEGTGERGNTREIPRVQQVISIERLEKGVIWNY